MKIKENIINTEKYAICDDVTGDIAKLFGCKVKKAYAVYYTSDDRKELKEILVDMRKYDFYRDGARYFIIKFDEQHVIELRAFDDTIYIRKQ